MATPNKAANKTVTKCSKLLVCFSKKLAKSNTTPIIEAVIIKIMINLYIVNELLFKN
jgi:hypothetical protein